MPTLRKIITFLALLYLQSSIVIPSLIAIPSLALAQSSNQPLNSASFSKEISPNFLLSSNLQNSNLVFRNHLLGVVSLKIKSLSLHTRSTAIEDESGQLVSDQKSLFLGQGIVTISRGISSSDQSKRSIPASISARIEKGPAGKLSYLRTRFTKQRKAGRVFEITAKLNSAQARVRNVSLRALTSKTCGLEAPQQSALTLDSSSSDLTAIPKTAAASTVKTFTVSTDCDFECYTKLGGSQANDRILEFYNSVNTIYTRDLNYNFNVTAQLSRSTAATYPLNVTVPDDLLSLLYKNYSSLKAADFRHLITGKIMQDSVVGLSYVGVACLRPNYTIGYSQHLSSLLTPIVIAHEMGHNLNASHDPQSQGIMTARLSPPYPTDFSSFSRNEILNYVNSLGRAACYDQASNSSSSSSKSSSSSSSSAAGGGSTVGNGLEAAISTRFSKSKFTGSITQASGSNCSVYLRAAHSESGLSTQSTRVFSSNISALEKISLMAANLPRVIVSRAGQRALVWFDIVSNCTEGTAVSESRYVNTAIVSSKAKGQSTVKTTKAWISKLKTVLQRG